MEGRSLRVAVIGAGTAGLCASRELRREGHRVTIFEKSHRVGGLWVYDPRVESDPMGQDPDREVVQSSLYRSLRTNLPRELMSFMDYPFLKPENGDTRSFPGHEEVLRFIGGFADDFGLVELVRFGHEVVRVECVGQRSDGWVVEWRSSGGDCESEVFQAVVVCNGKYTEPRIAHFSGIDVWPGLQMHSHNYRVPGPFKDKIVVIIGNGSSAFDLSREISSVAKEVHQATRSVNPIFEKMTGNDIASRKHPMIKCAREDGSLYFEDGSSIYADAIIHCTGYKYCFPFLRTNGEVEVEDTRVGPLYEHIFPPHLAPWLSFVGIPSMGGIIVMELQSKWIARVLSGKMALPAEEEMVSSVQEFYRQLEEIGRPKRHTHKLQNPFEYGKMIIEKLGLAPLEGWIEEMYLTMLGKVLPLHGGEFREAWDVDEWLQQVRA